MPWLIMGDLNDIMYAFEKEGGKPRSAHCMQAFRDALDDCHLEDVGYIGDKFTWHRGEIRERLDRALANEAWSLKFPDSNLHHLEYYRSDHRPILMCIEEQIVEKNPGPSVLRFEARWLKERILWRLFRGLGRMSAHKV
jgi:endonuclease/exonuclease/phosphatase family metal-dependent hydrolase